MEFYAGHATEGMVDFIKKSEACSPRLHQASVVWR